MDYTESLGAKEAIDEFGKYSVLNNNIDTEIRSKKRRAKY